MADNRKGQKGRKKGVPRSAGKRQGKLAAYFSSSGYLARKLRRVIRSSGYEAGKRWAERQAGMNDIQLLDLLRMRRPDGKKEMPNWFHDKMHEAMKHQMRQDKPGKFLPEIKKRVGRALRRHPVIAQSQ